MHQLWKHENGRWYVLYGPRLRRRISTGTEDRREAERFLAQFIAGASDPLKESPTVCDILEAYRDDRLPFVRSKNTLRGSVAALNSRLTDLLPEHLTPAVVRRYARERGVGAGTILREIGVLRAALSWAVEHQWIKAVPIISNPVPTPPPRDRWITRDEARAILAGCQEPHVKLFVILGLMTTARASAILEAKWSQVDIDRRMIDYGTGHGRKRRAVVPLNDMALAALKAAKELACSDYVIEFRGKPVRTIKNGFAAACRRAKVEGVTPHILRHSGATWMAMDGVPLAEIARMLGDTEATVEKVYCKFSPDFLKRASSALDFKDEENKPQLRVVKPKGTI